MRTPAFVCALAVLALSPTQAANTADVAHSHTLQGMQCLDPAQARYWIDEDSHHVLVDGGRYQYRVELASACTALQHGQFVGFRPEPVVGRVCGGLGAAVLTRDYPCQILGIELLSKEQYQQAVKLRKGYGGKVNPVAKSKSP